MDRGRVCAALFLTLACACSDRPKTDNTESTDVATLAATNDTGIDRAAEAADAAAREHDSAERLRREEQNTREAEATLAPLRTAAAASPANLEAQRRFARGLHDTGRHDQAVAQFERVAALDPGQRSLLDLALAYAAAARLDDAERVYVKLLEAQPGFAIALHNLGNLEYRRGRYDEAVAWYRKALGAKPDYLSAQSHLGDALKAGDRFEDAYRAYESVLDMEPRDPVEAGLYVDALYSLASLDLMMGAYERAGQLLSELIRAHPDHRAAYYAYGQVLLRLGQPEEAQKAFDAHLKLMAENEPAGPMAMGD